MIEGGEGRRFKVEDRGIKGRSERVEVTQKRTERVERADGVKSRRRTEKDNRGRN